MKFAFLLSLILLVLSGQILAADPDPVHALRRAAQEVVFHYGVVPAALVLAHPDKHPEREMHRRAAPKGASHLVVALFDVAKGERIADAEVTATVTLVRGASATKRLEPMAIANQPSFGGFFSLGAPEIYRLRFDARLPESELARFAASLPARSIWRGRSSVPPASSRSPRSSRWSFFASVWPSRRRHRLCGNPTVQRY